MSGGDNNLYTQCIFGLYKVNHEQCVTLFAIYIHTHGQVYCTHP